MAEWPFIVSRAENVVDGIEYISIIKAFSRQDYLYCPDDRNFHHSIHATFSSVWTSIYCFISVHTKQKIR